MFSSALSDQKLKYAHILPVLPVKQYSSSLGKTNARLSSTKLVNNFKKLLVDLEV
jgi:hypothetical protein